MTPSHRSLTNLRISFLLLLLSGLLMSGCGEVSELLTPAETLEAQNDGALIVDLRAEDDFAEFHIAKSINIPLEELSSRFIEMPPDEHIILVCSLGRSSLEAMDILLEAGYTSVSSMEGGVVAWYDAGYPGIFDK